MPKKARKNLTILILIILAFILIYTFNLFNFNNFINGVNIEKLINDNIVSITTTGKSLDLPKELKDLNITIQNNDKIKKIYTITNTKNNNTNISIEVETKLSADEVFTYYKEQNPSSISASNNNISTIITGDALNLIKITIEEGKYTIKAEKR